MEKAKHFVAAAGALLVTFVSVWSVASTAYPQAEARPIAPSAALVQCHPG